MAKKMGVFAPTTFSICKTMIITLAFEEKRHFSPEIAKIAEKCDHT
jgi:hypothetical protein